MGILGWVGLRNRLALDGWKRGFTHNGLGWFQRKMGWDGQLPWDRMLVLVHGKPSGTVLQHCWDTVMVETVVAGIRGLAA
jgi:hypothetical protein